MKSSASSINSELEQYRRLLANSQLEAKREFLQALWSKEKIFDLTILDRFAPNPAQKRFLESKARIRAFIAANKIGKCLTYQSLIESPFNKPKKIGEIKGKHWVWAWDGEKRVPALANEPFKKPAEECFRVWMADGRWFECAGRHRILTVEGGWQFFETLAKSLPSLPPSTSEFGLLTRLEDVQRYLKKQQDWRGDCFGCCHLCGGQLRISIKSDQGSSPLQDDARKPDLPLLHEGGLVARCTNIFRRGFFRLSNLCDRLLSGDRSVDFEAQGGNRLFGWLSDRIRNILRSGVVEASQPRQAVSAPFRQCLCASLVVPDGNESNQIISYQSVGVNDIYDFEVPGYKNYCTMGVVHHNTTVGVIDLLKFALQGGKVCRVVASLGFEKGVRDIILPEIRKWLPKDRLIKEKPNSQGITIKMYLRGDNGQESVISFMSGDQGDMSFEGDLIDYAWIDEPCRRVIYVATLRGLLISNGPMILTLTPIAEPWIYNDIFCSLDKEIECFQGSIYDALIENGGHLTPEQVKSFVDKIPEDERPARVYGKFKHLMGRIYKAYDEAVHLVKPFRIPKEWPVWCSIDPHARKPNAALWLAVSPEENWYVCNEVYWGIGIEEFGKEVLEVSRQYNMVAHLIDTSAETPDWNKRETARTILAKVGLRTRLARKKNQKKAAIMGVQQALEGKDGTNVPWLYVFESCKRTRYEFLNYIWDDHRQPEKMGIKEEPRKVDDEMMDNLHYITVEKPRYRKPRIIDYV